MSKWPMRGHFLYLRFKTFPMTPRTPQCEVFWALLSNPKHSGVPEDSKSPTLEVLGFTPTLGQSGVATNDQFYSPSTNVTKFELQYWLCEPYNEPAWNMKPNHQKIYEVTPNLMPWKTKTPSTPNVQSMLPIKSFVKPPCIKVACIKTWVRLSTLDSTTTLKGKEDSYL